MGNRFAIYRANFKSIEEEIVGINWEELFKDKNINEGYNLFLAEYERICDKHIPKKKPRKSVSDEVWMTKDLKYKVTLKKRSWHKMRNETDRKAFRKNSKALKQDITNAKKDYEKDLSRRAKKDPKLIYSYMRSKMEVKEQIRVLKRADGSLETESKGMADLLNSHFKSVFEADTLDPLTELKKKTEKLFELNQILSHLNETEIERRLKALKVC